MSPSSWPRFWLNFVSECHPSVLEPYVGCFGTFWAGFRTTCVSWTRNLESPAEIHLKAVWKFHKFMLAHSDWGCSVSVACWGSWIYLKIQDGDQKSVFVVPITKTYLSEIPLCKTILRNSYNIHRKHQLTMNFRPIQLQPLLVLHWQRSNRKNMNFISLIVISFCIFV